MNGKSDEKKSLKPYHYSLCGAVSGVMTRAVAQPLDVLKIRFQLQTEPIRRRTVSTGIKLMLSKLLTYFTLL